MAHPPIVVQENVSSGICLMLAALFWFATLDATVKYLMQSYPLIQVLWARFFIHVVVVLLWMGPHLKDRLRSRKPGYQLLRSLLLFGMTALWFLGLKTTPLATASTILFITPILVTILAWPVLGDFVGLRRWIGVGVGFVGALIVLRPDMGSIDLGLLALLGAATSNGFYQVITRKVRSMDEPLTSLFYSGLVGMLVLSCLVPFDWVMPTLVDGLWFLYAGLTGALSHWCLIRAFRVAPAPVLAPYSYTALVWASLLGYLVFGDVPDKWTMTGAGFIISGGLYIFHRERQIQHGRVQSV